MKKIIISTLAIMLAVPAFATGISPNDTGDNMCVYNVLNTYTGPANLTAGWQANTIQLKWYNGDQQLNVQSAANNCTYDSGLTIPSTAPTKTGYTFAGWKIKTVSSGFLCGLTSDELLNGTVHYWNKYTHQDGGVYCRSGESSNINNASSSSETSFSGEDCSVAEFSDLNVYEWKIQYEHGLVRGISSCTTESGAADQAAYNAAVAALMTEAESLESEMEPLVTAYGEDFEEVYENGQMSASDAALYESLMARMEEMEQRYTMLQISNFPSSDTVSFNDNGTGSHCWCRANSYTSNSTGQCSTASASWVYKGDQGDIDACLYNCARQCTGGNFYDNARFLFQH